MGFSTLEQASYKMLVENFKHTTRPDYGAAGRIFMRDSDTLNMSQIMALLCLWNERMDLDQESSWVDRTQLMKNAETAVGYGSLEGLLRDDYVTISDLNRVFLTEKGLDFVHSRIEAVLDQTIWYQGRSVWAIDEISDFDDTTVPKYAQLRVISHDEDDNTLHLRYDDFEDNVPADEVRITKPTLKDMFTEGQKVYAAVDLTGSMLHRGSSDSSVRTPKGAVGVVEDIYGDFPKDGSHDFDMHVVFDDRTSWAVKAAWITTEAPIAPEPPDFKAGDLIVAARDILMKDLPGLVGTKLFAPAGATGKVTQNDHADKFPIQVLFDSGVTHTSHGREQWLNRDVIKLAAQPVPEEKHEWKVGDEVVAILDITCDHIFDDGDSDVIVTKGTKGTIDFIDDPATDERPISVHFEDDEDWYVKPEWIQHVPTPPHTLVIGDKVTASKDITHDMLFEGDIFKVEIPAGTVGVIMNQSGSYSAFDWIVDWQLDNSHPRKIWSVKNDWITYLPPPPAPEMWYVIRQKIIGVSKWEIANGGRDLTHEQAKLAASIADANDYVNFYRAISKTQLKDYGLS